jgi:2-iminobutanoate/2-iminopropanoate deaminase
MTLDDLVYVQIFCTDMSLYQAFNKVYVTAFHQPYPARAFIGVNNLVFGAHFEIMGIAQRGAATHKTSTPAQP